MSLARQIAARMLAKKSSPRLVEAPRSSSPQPSPRVAESPPVPMAERRRRIAAGHARRNEPELDLVQAIQALPLPPHAPELAPAVVSDSWRGSCKAICAETGRQCRMPAHPLEPDRHRHERGPFFRVAAPGQAFTRRDLLDQAATRHNPEDS